MSTGYTGSVYRYSGLQLRLILPLVPVLLVVLSTRTAQPVRRRPHYSVTFYIIILLEIFSKDTYGLRQSCSDRLYLRSPISHQSLL